MVFLATPHKSARESDERFFVRKKWKTAGILCVFQGFTNVFLTEKIRQSPQTHLCGVAFDLLDGICNLIAGPDCRLQVPHGAAVANGKELLAAIRICHGCRSVGLHARSQ